MRKAIIAYVPAISRRYYEFLKKQVEGDTSPSSIDIYILGEVHLELLSEKVEKLSYLKRDLWSLRPEPIAEMLRTVFRFQTVRVLNFVKKPLSDSTEYDEFILPDDDVSRAFARLYLPEERVTLVKSRLRWDRMAALNKDLPPENVVVTTEEMHLSLMNKAYEWSEQSFDWWRQIGALAVRDGEILVGTYNREHPHLIFDMMGDSRTPFTAGENTELHLTGHAERSVVAYAAQRKEVSLEGSDLYVTTFPCRPCSVMIHQAGIKRLYYAEGYSRLEAAEFLIAHGVEIIKVDMEKRG